MLTGSSVRRRVRQGAARTAQRGEVMRSSILTIGRLMAAGALLAAAPALAQDAQWRDLLRGGSLSGWRTLGGKAPYAVEGGEVVGRSVLNSPNSWLATKEEFGDFILEYEAKVDPKLNSGVMIRGLSRKDYRGGQVHSYQAEIDSSPRGWSGGIYDEQRRGWLNPLNRNPAAQRAFRIGDWNRFRVEAIGNSIRTWVNGVPAANLVDAMTPRGFIALQVHSVPTDPAMAGLEARFRNVRILTKDVAKHATPIDRETQQFSYLNNELTEIEKAQGWRLLWDGRTTTGWKGAKLAAFPEKGWEIKDGVLSVLSSGGAESRHGGDIITTEEYSDFELQLDFRLAPGANSGIKYFVDPTLLKGEGSAIGPEFQLLDDERHPDAKLGVNGNRTIGSLYDLITATNLSEADRTDKRVNPPGEWNRARIVARGKHVEHWLNDIKVVEYERGTQMFRALVAYSKYKIWPRFGELERGPILLQDHGDLVSFRSIKLRPLQPQARVAGE
jgi:hypothetical protein